MPSRCNSALSPIPDCINTLGVLIAPSDRITSRRPPVDAHLGFAYLDGQLNVKKVYGVDDALSTELG